MVCTYNIHVLDMYKRCNIYVQYSPPWDVCMCDLYSVHFIGMYSRYTMYSMHLLCMYSMHTWYEYYRRYYMYSMRLLSMSCRYSMYSIPLLDMCSKCDMYIIHLLVLYGERVPECGGLRQGSIRSVWDCMHG
jgi:hypothetical protein